VSGAAENPPENHLIMANVFAILTAIVLAVSAFLAYKNSEAYSSDNPAALGIIQQREEQESKREKQQEHLADLKGQLKTTTENRVATETTAEEKAAVLAAQEKKNKNLEAKIASHDQKISENNTQIADMENRLKDTGDIKELVGELKQLKAEIAQLESGVEEDGAKLAHLTTNIKGTQTIIDDLKTQESNHVNKISYCRNTRIRSVFGNWGFVTLSSGNNGGVVQGSFLDVVRDGETIAKLYVTAVENSSAAAEVVPDSLKPDTVLMVGDEVLPAKKDAPVKKNADAKKDATPALPPGSATSDQSAPPAPESPPEPAPAEPAADSDANPF
jgi:hypothetical protein